ncbi:hypothetical protein J3R82DRAFT_3500 [Butyriboletus roseoflavus]|nr:hypothetical protein J3R82DRAFT_3500 [Butyriboletus roseoflavus]
MTMERFIDLVEDPTVCRNFLDSKDTNPSPPMWVMPLLNSTFAWNHTMHLQFTQSTQKKKKKPSKVVVGEQGPSVIHSGTWTSQGWRLVTHPGFITFPHCDCSGMCTYIIGNSGAKIWAVMCPKRVLCPDSSEQLSEILRHAITMSLEGRFSEADVATVCLEEGDIMFQPPGVLHSVYTPVPSIFNGGYFYNYETMHLT